jgi:Na+/proline symporter
MYAPGWLQIGVAVGLVAAAMSTIDTCSNVMALSVAYDLLGLHERPGANRASQAVTAASVVAACLFALNTESLWDIFYLSSGILTTTVAFPVAAVFLPGVRPRTVRWSAISGFAGTTIAYILESRQMLTTLQTQALSDSGLAYILWGIFAAAAGAALGQMMSTDGPEHSTASL